MIDEELIKHRKKEIDVEKSLSILQKANIFQIRLRNSAKIFVKDFILTLKRTCVRIARYEKQSIMFDKRYILCNAKEIA